MIWFTIKSLCYFVISFLILSISINKNSLFGHISSIVGPVGNDIAKSIGKGVSRTIDKSSEIGGDLFDNSPKSKSKSYAKKRKRIQQELIKPSEKEGLDALIDKEG